MENHVPLLKIENLSVNYDKKEVLRNISFHIHKGEIIGIIGESGCGKSTMLSSILGMLGNKGKIIEGTIYFNTENLLNKDNNQMRKILGDRIGMVYQNPASSLNPIKKIKDQFYDSIRAHKKITRDEALILTKNILKKLDLNDTDRILYSYPFEMSGGMNQRIAIGIAMVLLPELLLVDEPTSALDVTVQAQIIKEMKLLRDEYNTAIMIVTHNMGVVSNIADKIAVMYAGEIVEYGYKKNILKNPAHPYTESLIEAIPTIEGKISSNFMWKNYSSTTVGCAFMPRCKYKKPKCGFINPKPIVIQNEHWSTCDIFREGISDE